jgi:NAD(P)H dehydrogenase (quinone)
MRHLIVYSHPNPKSFNHAILETYTAELKKQGHEVRVRDLYELKFDPILKATELEGFVKGVFPKDIHDEQEHIRWAEALTLLCPIWWGGFTSQLRGYLDRVFSLGFAYDETPRGLLTDKKIFTINTIGAPESLYENEGFFKGMNKILDDIVFKFCGIQVVGHKYFSFVGGCTQEERRIMLEDVRELARMWV